MGGEDLTAIVNMARRRNRSVWAVLDELERQPGILRLAARDAGDGAQAGRPTCAATRTWRTSARPASCCTDSCAAAASSPGWSRRTPPPAEEALQNIARFFEIVRAQSALLADDRAVFVAPHLATLIEAGDDPATAELDPDADAVAVLTVHKAKGLEFPVVFLPGMVAGRFPLNGRGETLPLPAGLGRGEPATPEAEPRRGAAAVLRRDDPGARRADPVPRRGLRRRPGPPRLAVRARGPRPADDGRRARCRRPADEPDRAAGRRSTPSRPRSAAVDGPITEPLSLSFYQIDDYLTCPLKYKYAHVLRVPLAPHHAIIYGAALHKAVQMFHVRHAKGYVMSEAELDEVFESAWSNEGFVSRDHEEARLEAGRAALRRFRAAQLEPGRRDPDLRRARVQLQPRRRPRPGPMGPRRHRAGRGGERGRRGPRRRPRAGAAPTWSARPWACSDPNG